MGKGIGRLFRVGIGKEDSRGTQAGSVGFWIPFSEMAIEEKAERAIDEQAYGLIEDSQGSTTIKRWSEGNFKAPIGDMHFPLILYSLMGSLSSAVKETTAYNHTITVGQNAQHQSLTFFLDDPLSGMDYKHPLGVVQSVEISYELGKFIEYAANIKAKPGISASLTPTIVEENRFTPKNATFKIASTYSGLDAASEIRIKSFSIKIEQNIEDDDVIGSITPIDFINKQFTIEGSIEALWQNESDFKTAFLANTQQALRLDLLKTDTTIGASSNPRLQIDLAKCTFTELTRPTPINDLVMQTIGFKAHYSIGDSLMVSILATNKQNSY